MIIKLTDIDTNEKIGAGDAVKITGDRIDGEGEWSRKIFSDNRELRQQLNQFGIGDNVEVSLVQKGKFWNITSLSAPSKELVDKVKSGGGFRSSGGSSPVEAYTHAPNKKVNSGAMSKEEWAAKDIKTQASIARAVALKAAIEFCVAVKPKTTEEILINTAKKFMPFLMGEETMPADALEPPV